MSLLEMNENQDVSSFLTAHEFKKFEKVVRYKHFVILGFIMTVLP